MYGTNASSFDTRLRAIKSIQKGIAASQVADVLGVHKATLYRWIEKYKNSNGPKGLLRRKGSGRPRLFAQLNNKELLSIVLTPATKFGFETDFWTCRRIGQLIKTRFHVSFSKCTIWRRLRDAGLTYQKPERKYFEASEEDRRKWKRYEIPKIRRAVRKYKAILYFQDEANISLTALLGKTWAPSGKTPKQTVTGKRSGIGAMSAISGAGGLIFTLHEKRIASDEVIDFLNQMLKHHKRRHLVVVMDQARPHTSKKTQSYIDSQKRLHVFYLPKYSPDWNPDEKVWNHLKNQDLIGHQAKTKNEMKRLVKKKLTRLSKSPSKLRGIYFRCCVADYMK